MSDDDCDQDATADAVALMNLRLAARLRRRLATVVDATNTQAGDRRTLLGLAAANGMPAHAVMFNAPLQLVLARNAARPGPRPGARWGRAVPADIVTAQHATTAQLMADPQILLDEGFSTVETIHVCAVDTL